MSRSFSLKVFFNPYSPFKNFLSLPRINSMKIKSKHKIYRLKLWGRKWKFVMFESGGFQRQGNSRN